MLSGCLGIIGSHSEEKPLPIETEKASLAALTVRQLTTTQYQNSVRRALGTDVSFDIALEPDNYESVYANLAAASAAISESHATKYRESAFKLVGQIFSEPAKRDELVGCTPELANTNCSAGFLNRVGLLLFRRPLDTEEKARFEKLAQDIGTSFEDPWIGLQYALAAMLQSPQFLFIVEIGEPLEQEPDIRQLNAYELASRLSYLLTDSPPDDALLAAAESGDLLNDETLLVHAARLLDDAGASQALGRFFDEFMRLHILEGITKSPTVYPEYTPELAADFRLETRTLLVDFALGAEQNFWEVLTGRTAFVNSRLAEFYGIDSTGEGFQKVTLPESSPYVGLLHRGAFGAVNAGSLESSPTKRGIFVRQNLLCQTIPDPPPDVDTGIFEDPENTEGKTAREQLEMHRTNPACNGCHASFDPIGLAFEHFDGIGQYRETDSGLEIDPSGELDGTPFVDDAELVTLLAGDERVSACMVKQFYRHAFARSETPNSEPSLSKIVQQFMEANHSFRQLILALVASDTFRFGVQAEPTN